MFFAEDIQAAQRFNEFLEAYNITYRGNGGEDLEVLDDDEEGIPLKFNAYYSRPKFPENTDLNKIMNLYNNSRNHNENRFEISELKYVPDNYELQVTFKDVNFDDKILYL